jgi:Uma2 family endonuclease
MQQSRRHYTVDDYFFLQRGTAIKLEYFNGEIYAMAGGTRAHDRIAGNTVAFLHAALRGSRCEPFSSDMRIGTPSGLYTYPDVSVVSGTAEATGEGEQTTLTNPIALVEVLSDSTRDYDRGEKFELYRSIPALRHYLLIEQLVARVEHRWLEKSGEWASETKDSLDQSVVLSEAGVELPLARIYERVELSSPPGMP